MLTQWYVALPLVSIGLAAGFFMGMSWSRPSFVHVGSSKIAQQAFSGCPSLNTKYRALRFLSSGHTETIFASFLRKPKAVAYTRSTLTGPDGGTTAVDATAAKVQDFDHTLTTSPAESQFGTSAICLYISAYHHHTLFVGACSRSPHRHLAPRHEQ